MLEECTILGSNQLPLLTSNPLSVGNFILLFVFDTGPCSFGTDFISELNFFEAECLELQHSKLNTATDKITAVINCLKFLKDLVECLIISVLIPAKSDVQKHFSKKTCFLYHYIERLIFYLCSTSYGIIPVTYFHPCMCLQRCFATGNRNNWLN